MWLEENENPSRSIPKKDTPYAGTRLQKRSKINMKDGILKDQMGAIIGANNQQVNYSYAVDEHGELYAGLYPNHNYILGNKPVICAGDITICHGKIIKISNFSNFSNFSGHYKPTPYHLKQIVNLLDKKNVFSQNATMLAVYTDGTGDRESCSKRIYSCEGWAYTLTTLPHYWLINKQYMQKAEVNHLVNASLKSKRNDESRYPPQLC